MNKKDPVGGAWNFDASNRESYDDREKITPVRSYKQDKVTKKVAQLINQYFPDHMGDTKTFSYAVTPKDALRVYEHFLKTRAALFGKYQDAMVQDEPFMFHSVISPYLNAGLLLPNQVCELMIEKYNAGAIPLEAAEGFLRQIIGWREFIRGIYWLAMPAYKKQNYFDAHRKLPSFFWTGKTKMNCLKQVINQTIDHSYAHHIQRLMITGNFALLTSLSVDEVCTWYHIVYLDAHEWVELPNTLGMALCGDGGLLSSKPYCSSGAYINKMSKKRKKCPYNVKEKTGEKACPFNYLYWYFIIKKESKLKKFKRMALPLATAKKFDEKERKVIIKDAEKFLESLS